MKRIDFKFKKCHPKLKGKHFSGFITNPPIAWKLPSILCEDIPDKTNKKKKYSRIEKTSTDYQPLYQKSLSNRNNTLSQHKTRISAT